MSIELIDRTASGKDRCSPEMVEALNLFVDGELATSRQAEFFAHLATCDSCRHTLDSVMRFRRYGRMEQLVVPPATDDAFFKRLAQHKGSRMRLDRAADREPVWRLQTRISIRAAMLAAIVLFITGLLLRVEPPRSPSVFFVSGGEERVEFPQTPGVREAVYVFYPGLTIEASKAEELQAVETL